MRSLVRAVIVAGASCIAGPPTFAASPSEFYLGLLRRGIATHDAGNLDAAAAQLRIAAFGTLDSIEHYQTAQIYLALTLDRSADRDRAREAVRRVAVAERIESKFGSLAIPAPIRARFVDLAKRLLPAADLVVLSTPPQIAAAEQSFVSRTPAAQPGALLNPAASNQSSSAPPAAPDSDATVAMIESAPMAPAPPPVMPQEPPAQTKPIPAAPPLVVPRPAPRVTADVSAQFATAEQALVDARLIDARAIYRQLLESNALPRGDVLRVAEGLYRARDFAQVLRAFERAGTLARGEERYRYYRAVALYETGQYGRAKEELRAVLPFIELTTDVARYRARIEGTIVN